MLKSWILCLLLLCPLIPQAFAADSALNITVLADPAKANGEPWDGLPGLGGGRGSLMIPLPNSNAPPDLAICIVRIGVVSSDCLIRREGGKEYSFCQNAHDCTFHRVAIPDGPFGMIILDLDLKRHDLVDFLILKPESGASAAEMSQLEGLVRTNVEKLAPALTDGERQRRKREILTLALERCTGSGKGCKLVQSELRMNWTD